MQNSIVGKAVLAKRDIQEYFEDLPVIAAEELLQEKEDAELYDAIYGFNKWAMEQDDLWYDDDPYDYNDEVYVGDDYFYTFEN